ncbi:hypothetical protein SAMN03159444_04788 [Pseudomonas sp. NFACC02]|nr:hypothetical protein SAMN03159444_04788 [Pseudomonas sp. NFACC02]
MLSSLTQMPVRKVIKAKGPQLLGKHNKTSRLPPRLRPSEGKRSAARKRFCAVDKSNPFLANKALANAARRSRPKGHGEGIDFFDLTG